MNLPAINFSRKEKLTVIFAVTFGNLLEWYEIYLYVYWAPIIGKLFFKPNSELVNLTNALLVFAIGFLARPLGGVFFGRLGDRIGRRKALILSLAMMTVPTFITGLMPTFAQVGVLAPMLLILMRVFQSFPAGGELPGAACYLYESARFHHRRFMCSWASLGFQLGILISTLECFFLEKYLSQEDLTNWGWRLSFLIGGVLGVCGLFFRYKLHETPLYREMITHERIANPLLGIVKKYKKQIMQAILFCALNSSAFYILTISFPFYLEKAVGTSYQNNLLITSFLLLFITIPLPFFGLLGDRFSNKKLLIGSALGILILLFPLCTTLSFKLLIPLLLLFCLCFTCLSALLPYAISDLFPTYARFTCLGISFNIVDAIIGGFTPVIALYLYHRTGMQGAFCWFLLFCALLSLGSYLAMKEKHPPSVP
jgi:MHS family proline/betaine transporter-like MFS transporter